MVLYVISITQVVRIYVIWALPKGSRATVTERSLIRRIPDLTFTGPMTPRLPLNPVVPIRLYEVLYLTFRSEILPTFQLNFPEARFSLLSCRGFRNEIEITGTLPAANHYTSTELCSSQTDSFFSYVIYL